MAPETTIHRRRTDPRGPARSEPGGPPGSGSAPGAPRGADRADPTAPAPTRARATTEGAADGPEGDPGDGLRHVTGPHAGYDRYGRLDHYYYRCERCGLESTDSRLRRGCPRCGRRRDVTGDDSAVAPPGEGDRSGADCRDATHGSDGGE